MIFTGIFLGGSVLTPVRTAVNTSLLPEAPHENAAKMFLTLSLYACFSSLIELKGSHINDENVEIKGNAGEC